MSIIIGLLIVSVPETLASVPPTSAESAYKVYSNVVGNPGFEEGRTKWSASGGTFSITTTAANVAKGAQAASWNSSAASQTLSSSSVTIPAGLYGRNAELSAILKCASGTCTHKLQAYDGTNVIGESTITSNLTYVKTTINFLAPSSGSIVARIISVASDEPELFVDQVYLGEPTNLAQINQSTFWGSAITASAASCTWTTSSGTIGNFAANASCSAPSVSGHASAPSTRVPAIRFANGLPPGEYRFSARFFNFQSGTDTQCNYRFHDGTNAFGWWTSYKGGATPTDVGFGTTLEGHLSVATATSDITIHVQGQLQAGTSTPSCNINNDSTNEVFELTVYRYSTTGEQAASIDQVPQSWSGYHQSDCNWTRTNTAQGAFTADASCTFSEATNYNFGTVTSSGSLLPGIVIVPKRAGRFKVCADFSANGTTAGDLLGMTLHDVTANIRISGSGHNQDTANRMQSYSLCGIVNAPSTVSRTIELFGAASSGSVVVGNGQDTDTIRWSIFSIDQSFPAPVLVGSVTSNSSGAERLERAEVSATGVVSNESGNWINSNCGLAASVFTCTLNSGIFSATPVCIAQVNGGTSGEVTVAPASATSIVFNTFTSAGIAADRAFSVYCLGPK